MQTTMTGAVEVNNVARQTRFSFFGVPSLEFISTKPSPTSSCYPFSGNPPPRIVQVRRLEITFLLNMDKRLSGSPTQCL
jgi:hypothetical protein